MRGLGAQVRALGPELAAAVAEELRQLVAGPADPALHRPDLALHQRGGVLVGEVADGDEHQRLALLGHQLVEGGLKVLHVEAVERFFGELWILRQFDDSFCKGVVDTAHVGFYAVLIAVFLFWTVRSLESQRWR